MAAGDPVVIGQLVDLAWNDYVWVGVEVQRIGHGHTSRIREVLDLRDTPVTKIISNPGETITVGGVIEGHASATYHNEMKAIIPGHIVTLNTGGTKGSRTDEKWFVVSRRIDESVDPTTFELDLVREDHLAGVATIGYDALTADQDLTA